MRINRFALKTFFLLIITFITVGCEEDSPEINSQSADGTITRKISLEELKQRPVAYQKMLQYYRRDSNGKRTIHNNKYEFSIDTDDIIYVEKGDYHSYTFAIYSDEDKGYTENLFLHLQPDGSYTAFLIQYDFDEADFENFKDGKLIPNLSAKTVFYPLPDFDSDSVLQARGCLQSMTVSCTYQVTVTTTPRDEGDLVGCNSPDCLYDYVYTYTLVDCTYTSTDCGGLETSGPVYDMFAPHHGSSGGPSLYNDPIIGISVSDDAKHIRELKKITDANSPLRYIIDQYHENLDNPLIEEGIEFRLSNLSYSAQPAQFQTQYSVKFFPSVVTSLIRIHKHHLSTDPVFSEGDIFAMAEFYNQKNTLGATDKENITSAIVSKNGIYAFRIDDVNKVQEFYNSLDAEMDILNQNGENMIYSEYIIAVYQRDVVRRSQKQCGGVCSDEEYDNYLHENFIKFFSKINHGLLLYYAPHSPNGNYVWTKISN